MTVTTSIARYSAGQDVTHTKLQDIRVMLKYLAEFCKITHFSTGLNGHVSGYSVFSNTQTITFDTWAKFSVEAIDYSNIYVGTRLDGMSGIFTGLVTYAFTGSAGTVSFSTAHGLATNGTEVINSGSIAAACGSQDEWVRIRITTALTGGTASFVSARVWEDGMTTFPAPEL